MKPMIGITCNYDYKDTIGLTTDLGAPLQDWDYIACDYANAVMRAGGLPIIIPNGLKEEDLDLLLDRLDGLLLSGGSDVDPRLYNEEPSTHCGPVFLKRDRMETELIRKAYARRMPILGICRGLQMLSSVFGGNMYQDLPSEKNVFHSSHVYTKQDAAHYVALTPNSAVYEIYETDSIGVNSYHHQSIRQVSENGTIVGVSADGVIEAVEFSGGHPFTIGVQWHPEMMSESAQQQKIFSAFIKACK